MIAYLGVKATGGYGGQQTYGINFKLLTEKGNMQKTATKNIFPSESNEFLKIWVAIKPNV